MTEFYKLDLRAGDRVLVPKWPVTHHAIYDGFESMYENRPNLGVIKTPISEFFGREHVIKRIIPFSGSEWERANAITRAGSLLGKPYHLLSFNCEHYANYIQYGQYKSKQVDDGIVLGLIFGTCIYINSQNKKTFY